MARSQQAVVQTRITWTGLLLRLKVLIPLLSFVALVLYMYAILFSESFYSSTVSATDRETHDHVSTTNERSVPLHFQRFAAKVGALTLLLQIVSCVPCCQCIFFMLISLACAYNSYLGYFTLSKVVNDCQKEIIDKYSHKAGSWDAECTPGSGWYMTWVVVVLWGLSSFLAFMGMICIDQTGGAVPPTYDSIPRDDDEEAASTIVQHELELVNQARAQD